MTTMVSEVYDALISVGVSPEKARHAAEAMLPPSTEPIMAKVEPRFGRIESDIQKLQIDVTLLKWMVGGLYALFALAIPAGWLLVRIAFKTGALVP